MEADDDFLPLSALQHYLYCPRQCALIHVEQQWAESRHTAEGRLLHERADQPRGERRRGVRTVTAMPLANPALRIAGIADVVEFHDSPGNEQEQAVPVEYKRGRPKAHRADEVQLCAQALCLEAMLEQPVPAGALFYGATRRRKEVAFDATLRRITLDTIEATRAMLDSGTTPGAVYEPRRCDACSLIDLCQPRWLARGSSVNDWLARHLAPSAAPPSTTDGDTTACAGN
ncbi:CRISPR-associated protein Cas4 [Paracidovorax konjaci]|uniref:CRISPR-associated exonuclease Cas4 n=1 Tax=Paracidovorax konjaci TaxID=32040 RepID=A0A1I1SEM1_9BURK|nr:CRISPR-associated protein Cas4 [Paracidovorax konjaci]SFD44939.1 CRISPR-associated exonuclease, Cas4 family [Paracidovorax konjaci]